MGFVNLKEMAKQAKVTEEKIMDLVDIGVIKSQRSYCHPGDFGDGREIAFIPENALADINAAKTAPKVEPEVEPEEEETVEEPEEEEEEKEEPEPESKPEPEPEAPDQAKVDELKKKEKQRLDMIAAEKAKKKEKK